MHARNHRTKQRTRETVQRDVELTCTRTDDIDGNLVQIIALVAIVCVVFLMCTTLFPGFVRQGAGQIATLVAQGVTRYAVVIDAGSSGSRVHLFEFLIKGGHVRLIQSHFEEVRPGLSSFTANPGLVRESLRPLLNNVVSIIPQPLRSLTSLQLGATAGLRSLHSEDAERLLLEARAVCAEFPFSFSDPVDSGDQKNSKGGVGDITPSDIRIISGGDEGRFSWIAVNFFARDLEQSRKGA